MQTATWQIEGESPNLIYTHSSGARAYKKGSRWFVTVEGVEYMLPRKATLDHAESVISTYTTKVF